MRCYISINYISVPRKVVKKSDKLVTCICAYVPQTGRSAEEKDSFWDQMISVTGSIPASELTVVGGDLNGHIGTNIDGYDGVNGRYGFGQVWYTRV